MAKAILWAWLGAIRFYSLSVALGAWLIGAGLKASVV